MNRFIFVAVAAAAAGGIATAPAIAGLSHNPSFSHQLPVRVPSGAQTVNVDDEHRRAPDGVTFRRSRAAGRRPSRATIAGRTPRTTQDAQDNDALDNDVNDDNGVHGAALEPGDDNGHDGQVVAPSTAAVTHEAEPEPGDDRGGATAKPVTASPAPQPAERGDDKGGSSGRQSGGHGDN